MSLKIIKYNSELEKQWDEFVSSSINGTFLHKRSFFNANDANDNDDCSFLILKKNKVICLIPGCLLNDGNKNTYHSHPRATYGGFIFNDKVGTVESVQIVDLLINALKEYSCSKVIIRNPFRIFYKNISDEFEYAMWFHNFYVQSRELEIYIPLNTSSNSKLPNYENGTKYNVKKAWKHVEVKEGTKSDLKQFWDILTSNLKVKHNKTPTHSIDEISKLISTSGTTNFKLIGAYKDEQLVGGCFMFIINDSLHAQYIGQDDTYQEFRPINAVIDFIIQWGFENGYKYFNLGTANEGGKTINQGLFHFKESFGGRGVLRETHELIIKQ